MNKDDLYFVPLGGSAEIGMNLNLYAYRGKWLMIDCGIGFDNRLGIEVITPDTTYIEQYRNDLVGIVITHAHEDHVGAVPYLWQRLRCPVYATKFTANVLRAKLAEYPWGKDVPIHEVELGATLNLAPFRVEFVSITHSIPEANVLAIHTDAGVVVHTGDWKIDPEPLVGALTHTNRLEQLGNAGVLAMVCDSTNVFNEGHSGSEEPVRRNLIDVVAEHPDRQIVVACFASNVARLESAAIAALENHRRPVLIGRSMLRMDKAARDAGYMQGLKPFLTDRQLNGINKNSLLYICTGSQGEPRSAMMKIAFDKHPEIALNKGDVVIFSSRVIPGNEKAIATVQNQLVRKGIEVIAAVGDDLHVSGHPARDELRQMYAWIRPHVAIPVHGEARHLSEHVKLARLCGVPETVLPHNGACIRLTGKPEIVEDVPSGRFAVDGARLIASNSQALQERYKASVNGMVFVSLTLDRNDQISRPVQLDLYGLICPGHDNEDDLQQEVISVIHNTVRDHMGTESLEEALRTSIRRYIDDALGKRPVVIVHLG